MKSTEEECFEDLVHTYLAVFDLNTEWDDYVCYICGKPQTTFVSIKEDVANVDFIILVSRFISPFNTCSIECLLEAAKHFDKNELLKELTNGY